MKISVIIPHKNDETSLEICLELLAKQSLLPAEIIVVDNNSKAPNEVRRVCEKYGAILIDCPEGGSYMARNRGIKSTKADLLIFTDADCRPCPVFVESYKRWSSSNDRLIAAGPVDAFSNSRIPNGWECLDIDSGYPQRRYVQSGVAMTANLSVKRQGIERFGEFDGTLFSGGDFEFSGRIARNSGGIDWVREAIVEHPARSNRADAVERMKRTYQGVAETRVNNGLSPVPFRTWFLLLFPPVARIPRINRIPGVTVGAILQAFVYACYLRVVLFCFLLSVRRHGAARRLAGRYK
ncbi:MAG TPA: glycosyltransferase family A protein [Opitutaceae bacterium]|jgi:hypothetical protein